MCDLVLNIIISSDIKTYFDPLRHKDIHDANDNAGTNKHTLNGITKDYCNKIAKLHIKRNITSDTLRLHQRRVAR